MGMRWETMAIHYADTLSIGLEMMGILPWNGRFMCDSEWWSLGQFQARKRIVQRFSGGGRKRQLYKAIVGSMHQCLDSFWLIGSHPPPSTPYPAPFPLNHPKTITNTSQHKTSQRDTKMRRLRCKMQNKCDETPQPVIGRGPTTSQFIIGDRYPIFFPRVWTCRTCLKNNKRVWIGMNSMKKILAAASSWYFTLQHFLGFKPVRLSVPVMLGLVCHRCHHLALGPKRCALNQPKSGTKV